MQQRNLNELANELERIIIEASEQRTDNNPQLDVAIELLRVALEKLERARN